MFSEKLRCPVPVAFPSFNAVSERQKRMVHMRYEIVEADSPQKLSEQVNEKLASGWELYGNFAAVSGGTVSTPRLFQPMVFKEIDRGFPLKKRNLRIA